MEKQNILIVDDDASVREALAHALSFENLQVVVAANSAEALRESLRRKFDFVLLDLHLGKDPEESGLDLLQVLHETAPSVPVLMMSGFPEEFANAKAQQAAALLEKPLDLPILLRKLGELSVPAVREQKEIRAA
jgi:DNA-binding NtrC family response regulator